MWDQDIPPDNQTKILIDLVTVSDFEYSILVYDSSNKYWDDLIHAKADPTFYTQLQPKYHTARREKMENGYS